MKAGASAFYSVQAVHGTFTDCLLRAERAGEISGAEKAALGTCVQDSLRAGLASQIFLARQNSRPVLWAGALLLETVNRPNSEVFLFTLLGKLARFASLDALRQALQQQLDTPAERHRVLRFVPLQARAQLQMAGLLALQAQPLASAPLTGLSESMHDYIVHCQERTLASLISAPSLHSILGDRLLNALQQELAHNRHEIESIPSLMQAVLQHWWQAPFTSQLSPHDYCVARQGDLFYQQCLQGLHDQQISPEQFDLLERLVSGVDVDAQVQTVRLSVFDPNLGEVKLAGLTGVFFARPDAPVFLFGGADGLQQYPTRARLKTRLLSALRSPTRFEYTARNAPREQQPVLAAMTEPGVSVEHFSSNAFEASVQSIRDKQLRDFGFMFRALQAEHVALVGADHGLDVRLLVDGQLLALNTAGRWSTRFVPEGDVEMPAPPVADVRVEVLATKLTSIGSQLDELLRPWPAPVSYARLRLQEALARAEHGALDIDRIMLRLSGTLAPMSLVTALLLHVTGQQPLPLDPALIEAGLQAHGATEIKPLRSLLGTKVRNVLEQAGADFFQGFAAHVRAFFFTPYSPSKPDALIDRLSTMRLAMLRAELRLMQPGNQLSATDRAVLTTVLGQPVSGQRPALARFVPDVFGVVLWFNGAFEALDVVNCLLFTQRGGLESATAGRAIFWSPGAGFEAFATVADCQTQLQSRLADKALRWDLLAHIRADGQQRVSTWLDNAPAEQTGWLYFERFEQDFTRQVQQRVIARVLADAEFACRHARAVPLPASAFENLVQSLWEQDRARIMLERVSEKARLQGFEAVLPGWLKNAPGADQVAYARLLQGYRQAGQGQQNYLRDIPALDTYARSLLVLRLELDFAGQALNPDTIEVVIDTYLAAPVPVGSTPSFLPAATTRTVQTLTQFALNGFYRLNAGAISLRTVHGGALPEALNAAYVRQLTRQLDIGAHYRALLQDKLAPGNPGVAVRQQQFVEQLSTQVMEQVLREKLMDPGKKTAWRYLQQVIGMPDGVARLPLDRVPIVVRPFELIAEPEASPDRARGLYIVGPVGAGAGPQILWVNYSEHFSFKEYRNESALLEELRTSTQLQALVLQRLAPQARKIYDHGGFTEPHLSRYVDASPGGFLFTPAPAALGMSPVAGNLFDQLYNDNYHLLLDMAEAQSKTTAETDWEAFKYVFSLIVSTALMFLPGKLSIPLVVWQSLGSIQQGVEAAKMGDWGEAVAEFASSLAMLGGGARAPREGSANPDVEHQTPAPGRLTAEQEAGLQPFQVSDVALIDLEQDPVTRLYRHPRSAYNYVLLAGHVFRVLPWRGHWRIFIGEQREGPLVTLNDRDQWQLDLQEPLLGGGPVYSSLMIASDRLTHEIQATGMPSIARRFPQKALAIREAHAQAITYLQRSQNALQHLLEPGAQNEHNRALVEAFFYVQSVDRYLLDRLNETVQPLLARFLHPDLSPLTSSKYVACRARFNDKAIAWVHRWDTRQRLYLSEHFFSTVFDTPYAVSQNFVKATQPPFRTNVHFRAAFLLHEISHQVLDTEDINYLNPGFPYEDLLDDTTTLGGHIKTFNHTLQICHSPHIASEHLFQQLDPEDYAWTDISNGAAKARVKAITGVHTLEQARPIFQNDAHKRIELMLANADSVVLLLTRLGRDQPVVPPPVVLE